MSLLQFFKKSFTRHTVQNAHYTPTFCSPIPCKSLCYTPQNRFYQNATVYRCVNYISTSVGQVKLIVNSSKDKSAFALQHLINQPNSHQHQTEFLETMAAQYLLYGNVYILGEFQNAHPTSLYLLDPTCITVVPGKYGEPKGYQYDINNHKEYIPYKTDNVQNILHIKNFNPNNSFLGFSPLVPISQAINQIDAFYSQKRVCHPSGVFRYKGILPLKDKLDELTPQLQAALSNHNPILLDKDIDWEPCSQPNTTCSDESLSQAERTIAQVYSIPPSLIGITEPKFSNFAESRKQFWQDAVMPIIKKFTNSLHHWLVSNPHTTITWDPQSLPNCATDL